MFRICIVGGIWLLSGAMCNGAFLSAALAETPAQRGDYLVNTIMACGNCHSPRDANGETIAEKAFSGGLTFDTPAFVATAPNITPDVETGIGSWSDAEIKRALVEGMRPDHGHFAGVPLAAIMPANFYKALLPDDLTPSLPTFTPSSRFATKLPTPSTRPRCIAIPIPPPRPDSARPCSPIRSGAAPIWSPSAIAWNATPHGRAAYRISKPASAVAAGCSRAAGWNARQPPPPTLHRIPAAGIGAWSDAEISRAITHGMSRDGRALKPPMAYAYYAALKQADLADIIAYLRTVPPLQ